MLDFAIFAVTFLLALVAAVLYLYPASRQAAGIPGIAPTEEKDGNLPDIINSGSLHEFLVNLHEKYGPVASFWFGRRLVVSLGTADILKQHFNPNKTSDPFETMLKSLLGYQSGGGSVSENHMRRKLYGNAVAAALQSNFPLLLKASRQAAGIPGIAPTEEKDGNLPDIINSGSLHEFLVNLHEKYGPVASFWFGRRLVVSLGTADILKQHFNPNKTSDPFETMLKSLLGYQSGGGSVSENHMRRKLYGNAVAAALQSNFPLLLKLSEELLDKWLSYPETQHVPLSQHMLGFALKSVTRMVLGSTFEDEQEVIRFQKIHGTVWSEIGKGFLDGSLDKNTTRKKQYDDALMQLESILKKIIKERKGRNFSQHIFIDSLIQGNLTEQQILEDSMIFSLAGCIITAKLCTWAMCFLTTSQEVQRKLHKEIDRVFGKDPITSEKIDQLRYCRQVLCETVRTAKLTPVSARLQDIEGKVGPFVIPKETLILYALGVVLQDPSTWPSPHKFDPDRFADESVMEVFSSLGFSGTWECPELRFAYMVTTVLVGVLVRRLHLFAVEGQVFEMKYELVTSSREEAWITVSKRY